MYNTSRNRHRWLTRSSCRIILITSLFWVLVDVFVLMYLTDCSPRTGPPERFEGKPQPQPPDGPQDKVAGDASTDTAASGSGLLHRLIAPLMDRLRSGYGENGRAVSLPSEVEAEAKEKFHIHQFNIIASDLMSLNRSLPDYRSWDCQKRAPNQLESLPNTSVVIVFHNEAWSTLLRTVHSVINRSPLRLLHEIILVDDASDMGHLGDPLDTYVSHLPVPVRVLRMKERVGLIRARLEGAAASTGSVLTFLDAHCETTPGWLEPLLDEIHKDRTSVVCPIIDVISDENFEYITGSDMTWGSFNWKMNFRWSHVPERELSRRNYDRSLPLRSPTMAGGLFSIDRKYFYEIGSYDSGMEIWGGENLEMSFRIWMCGGSILIAPCSRVGHVFRKTSPYSWPGGVGHILSRNTMRTVMVWLEEYAVFYLAMNPGSTTSDYGDIKERLEFKKTKQCKPFRWYLENIYPESLIPLDYYAIGAFRLPKSNMCLDNMGRKAGEKVGMFPCHNLGGNQIFAHTKNLLLQTDEFCVQYSRFSSLKLIDCDHHDRSQLWNFDPKNGQLEHVESKMCMGAPHPYDHETPSMEPCAEGGQNDQHFELPLDKGSAPAPQSPNLAL